MEALQAQIEPHFLFNTLASIDQLIQTDPPRASQDAAEPDPLPALGDAADARRRPTARSASRSTCRSAFLEIMAVRMEERLHAGGATCRKA